MAAPRGLPSRLASSPCLSLVPSPPACVCVSLVALCLCLSCSPVSVSLLSLSSPSRPVPCPIPHLPPTPPSLPTSRIWLLIWLLYAPYLAALGHVGSSLRPRRCLYLPRRIIFSESMKQRRRRVGRTRGIKRRTPPSPSSTRPTALQDADTGRSRRLLLVRLASRVRLVRHKLQAFLQLLEFRISNTLRVSASSRALRRRLGQPAARAAPLACFPCRCLVRVGVVSVCASAPSPGRRLSAQVGVCEPAWLTVVVGVCAPRRQEPVSSGRQ